MELEIITLLFLIIFVLLKNDDKFKLVSLSAFFPLSFGNFFNIKDMLLIEIITPIFFLINLNILLKTKKRFLIFNSETRPFLIAILFLITSLVYSYIRLPVSSQVLLGANQFNLGIRIYYKTIINILLFFSVLIFIAHRKENQGFFIKYLRLTLYFSLFVGIARLITYFQDFNLPLFAGTFKYKTDIIYFSDFSILRIGGLAECVSLSIPIIFSTYHFLTKKHKIISLIISLSLLFMSGGRTLLFGIVILILIYFIIEKNIKAILNYLIPLLIILLLFNLSYTNIYKGQIFRFLSVFEGFEQHAGGRDLVWYFYIQSFLKNIFFGKGISYFSGYVGDYGFISEFAAEQLLAGGHGSYLSLLGIFGLFGFIFILTFVFYSIMKIYKILVTYKHIVNENFITLKFVFFYLTVKSIEFLTSNDGYSDVPFLFFTVALFLGIISKNKYNLTL